MGNAEKEIGTKPVEGRMLFLLQHPLRRRLLGLYVESDDPLSPKGNDSDLAEIGGHRSRRMLARYAHAVGQSFGPARSAVG